MRTRTEILKAIEEQQEIQMVNHPSSKKWVDASDEIHRLAEILEGKKIQDAWGK